MLGAGEGAGATYYDRYCSRHAEGSVDRGYCEAYVDQCAAKKAEIKDPNETSYMLESDGDKTATGLDFYECLQLTGLFTANGAPKGYTGPRKPKKVATVRTEDAAKFGAKRSYAARKIPKTESGKRIVLHDCNGRHFGKSVGGRLAWIGKDVPEYDVTCVKFKRFGGDEAKAEQFALAKAETQARIGALMLYCSSEAKSSKKVDFVVGKYRREETSYSWSSDGIKVGPLSGVETFTEYKPGEVCVHAFFNWSMITCKDGREYVCE